MRAIQGEILYRAVAGVNRAGLVPVEAIAQADGAETATPARMAVHVRGGICWPFPAQVGTQMVAAGGGGVVGWLPGEGVARVLSWRPVGSIAPVYDGDGWPIDGGVVGAVRDAALDLHCWRFNSVWRNADIPQAARAVRRHLFSVQVLRFSAIDELPLGACKELVFRWATEGRLMPPPPGIVLAIDKEEVNPGAPTPATFALAAALHSLDVRPYRAPQTEAWQPITPDTGPATVSMY